jgi:plastocyanin
MKWRVRALGVTVAAALLGGNSQQAIGAADTGAISGRVHVVSHPTRRLATAGVYPGRIVSVQAERDASELDNVVVFVNTETKVDAPPQRVTIRQTGEEFVPHVVAVTTGSTVDFPNDDLIFHNVFSLSRAATFDLGRYPRNASKSRTFTKPGIVKVFCHLHSHMSAIVRVFSHPYFAIPDRDGRFTLPDVPAGTHRVSAWHERAGEVTHSTTVAGGAAAELSFSLPLTDPE